MTSTGSTGNTAKALVEKMKNNGMTAEHPSSKAIDAINKATAERNEGHWIDRSSTGASGHDNASTGDPRRPNVIPSDETMKKFIKAVNDDINGSTKRE